MGCPFCIWDLYVNGTQQIDNKIGRIELALITPLGFGHSNTAAVEALLVLALASKNEVTPQRTHIARRAVMEACGLCGTGHNPRRS